MGIIEQLAEIKEKEGVEKGIEMGEEKANRLVVESLLKNSDFSLEKISSMTNISLDFVQKVQESLSVC